MNLQQLDTQKKSKIKAAQNVSATEAKVNERNTQINEDEVKSFLHDDLLIKIIKIVIVANKKMLINQHHFDIFTLKQRVYLNNSNSRKNVMMIVMKINWKLNKRLKESTLIITHHEELKKLIAKMKHLADVAIKNRKYHEKIYKVYSDSQTSLKTVKVMISTKNQTCLQQV